jgi:membrane-bound lytic murein transglycosylase A
MNSAKPRTISRASHHMADERSPKKGGVGRNWRTLCATCTVTAAAMLGGCTSLPQTPAAPCQCPPAPAPPSAGQPPAPPAPAPVSWAANLKPVGWEALPGWNEDRLTEAWSTFLRSCTTLRARPTWQPVCASATTVDPADEAGIRQFFEGSFAPHAVINPDGSDSGMITGYYEPLLTGSRTRNGVYRFPIYAVPDDLLTVDLGEVYPEVKSLRLRGRLDGKRVVPYFPRADIEAGKGGAAGKELLWVDDAVDLFFLQVQGSGRVALDSGETVRVSYADQNGYPYRSIGRTLVDRGELPLDQASMQGIKSWGARNPERVAELLNQNASYVFFKELPVTSDGPNGSLGVALTAGRSLAVDTRAVPLGAPVFLATTFPNSTQPLNRLMVAQDTGGAIRGAVRADFYWGFGEEASTQAGRMRQNGRMWVLLPRGFALEQK